METSSLKFDLKFDYDSLTLPKKVIIPIDDGQSGPIKYSQHATDPLAIEQIKFSYANPDHVQVHMRVTGRVALKNLPDLKLGGTYLTVVANISLHNKTLFIKNPKLSHIDVPHVPDIADDFIQKLINKHIVNNLSQHFAIDLTATFALFEKTLNTPIPFNVTVLAGQQAYAFDLNGTFGDPILHVRPEHLQCEVEIQFTPSINEM